jgi:4-amino-4-deoxy-L-arabinose transferase-like glycosyltransferase
MLAFNLFFLVVKIVYVNYSPYDLHTEEAQYWLWSKNLAWSYYSKPPLVGWMNWIATQILGDTEIAVKSNALFVGFLLPILMYLITKRYFGFPKLAFTSSLILMVMPYYTYITMFFTTDTYLVFFWFLTLYFTWEAIRTDKWKYWILSGLSFGFGVLSKYTMLLFLPFLVFYSFINKPGFFRNKKFYLFLIVAVLFFLPEIIWNWQNNFVSFKHLFNLSDINSKFDLCWINILNILEYLGSQLLLFSPFFIPLFWRNLSRTYYRHISFNHPDFNRFILNSSFFGLLVFLFLSPKGVNINWTLFLFIPLPIFLGYIGFHYSSLKKLILPLLLTLFIQVIAIYPLLFDSTLLDRLYPGNKDTMKRMYGWEEIAKKVDDYIPEKDNIFVFSDNYHIASELSFYSRRFDRAFCINEGRRMNQFDLWSGINQFSNQNYDGIYVSKSPPSEKVFNAFEIFDDYKIIEINYRDKMVRRVYVCYFKGFGKYNESKNHSY